jgi:hypothetical protein
MQLSLEQKAYLKSIKSKKKRKAQKLDFKAHNFIFGNDYSETFESITNKLKDINNIKVEYYLVKEKEEMKYTLEDMEKCFESARATKEPFTKDFFFKDFKQYFNLKLMIK